MRFPFESTARCECAECRQHCYARADVVARKPDRVASRTKGDRGMNMARPCERCLSLLGNVHKCERALVQALSEKPKFPGRCDPINCTIVIPRDQSEIDEMVLRSPCLDMRSERRRNAR